MEQTTDKHKGFLFYRHNKLCFIHWKIEFIREKIIQCFDTAKG